MDTATEILEAPTSFNGQGLDTDLSKATVNVFLSALDVTERNTKTATYKIKEHLQDSTITRNAWNSPL